MPANGDGVATQGYLVTDAQTPWAASAQTDPPKEAALSKHILIVPDDCPRALEGYRKQFPVISQCL